MTTIDILLHVNPFVRTAYMQSLHCIHVLRMRRDIRLYSYFQRQREMLRYIRFDRIRETASLLHGTYFVSL